MPATQSQSTRVKPRNSQRCARSEARQGLVTPGLTTCALIVARVPWSTLNLPGPPAGSTVGAINAWARRSRRHGDSPRPQFWFAR